MIKSENLLAYSRPFLTDFRIAGKVALRIAGEIAMRYSAGVTVSSIKDDIREAELLTAIGQRYLSGFRLSSIDTVEQKGEPESEEEVLKIAESSGADIIIIGEKPHGLLDRFWGKTVDEEDIVLATCLPILIAR